MSQFRIARLSLMLAALGLSAAPALMTSAHAQDKKAAPAAAAPKADAISPELFKIMDPAAIQKLLAEKKFDEVQSKLAAAEAFPNRTPFETYILNRLKVALGSQTNNDKMTMEALEYSLASGRLAKEETDTFTQAIANIYYNQKNYPKAVEYLKKYQASATDPTKVNGLLARSLYLAKDYPGARAQLEANIAADEKAGKPPAKEDLVLLASAAGLQKDVDVHYKTLEKQLALYPDDEVWIRVIKRMQNTKGFNHQRLTLDVYRLESTVAKEMEAGEYVEMAELALQAGLPTEAKNAVDAGFAANVLGTGSDAGKHKALRDRVNKQAADDAKTIASGEASAIKSKDGNGLVNLGYAYTTMGQFDKGIDMIEKGIAKGGMKRPEEAQLKLGVAYAKAGRKDDAVKAFAAAKSNDGVTDLARLWTLWLNRPTAVAAAAPAPAPAK